MDRMIYIAMTGAKQTMLAQSANSHNMANANTTGFRADLAAFRAMPVFGDGQPSRVYAMAERPGVDLNPGAINNTGRELDVAINGEGWIAVQTADGSEAYTRAGNLNIGEGGILTTAGGEAVLGNGGPIAIPQAEQIEIGADGTITIQGVGQTPSTLAVVDRIKLVKPDPSQLYKGDDGLMRLKEDAIAPADASVNLVSGALETSNVNAVEAMVNMISLARQYEAQVNMMKKAEEMDAASNEILRIA